MEFWEKKSYTKGGIYPDNDATRRMLELEKQKEEERLREEQKKKKQNSLSLEEMLKKQKDNDEELKRLQEQDEFEQDLHARSVMLQQMEGNLVDMVRQLMNNTSSYDISLTGLDIEDRWNFTNLMLFLPDNKSCLSLNMSRKKLSDIHASQIGEMLKTNKKLRRLELEGNQFGPEACKSFADALKVNKTLRYLDLENNKLTDFGKDTSGVEYLFNALRDNTHLLSINLKGNMLNEVCGNAIVNCLRQNKTLIHLEIFGNQGVADNKNINRDETESKFMSKGLSINQVKEIKECLAENRKIYDAYRLEEWRERKVMLKEDDDMKNYNLVVTKQKYLAIYFRIVNETKQDDKNYIYNYYNTKYNEKVNKIDSDFNSNVDQYFAEYKESKNRGRGRRGRGRGGRGGRGGARGTR
jgi:hypothetical protein